MVLRFGSYAFYPIGLAMWGSIAGAIGVQSALWLAFGLFVAAAVALVAVPDVRRYSTPASVT